VHRGPTRWKAISRSRSNRLGAALRLALVSFDHDGQRWFVDRKKDLIKSGWEHVASVKV